MKRALVLVLLVGCGASTPPVSSPPSPTIDDVAWLTLGPWRAEPDAEGCIAIESWHRVDEAHLAGQGVTACPADDSVARVLEDLSFEARAEGVFYVATPSDQTRAEFRLTEADPAHFVVENPAHDFPTRIAYRRVDETHLEAEVSGPGRSFTVAMTTSGADPR